MMSVWMYFSLCYIHSLYFLVEWSQKYMSVEITCCCGQCARSTIYGNVSYTISDVYKKNKIQYSLSKWCTGKIRRSKQQVDA